MMNKDELTITEGVVLEYVRDYKTVNGFAPTMYEIAEGCYMSRTCVRNYLYRLQDKGYIQYNPNKRRSIIVKRFL